MIDKDKLFPFCYFGACILMVLGILFNDVIAWIGNIEVVTKRSRPS